MEHRLNGIRTSSLLSFSKLIRLQVFGNEVEERCINPWVDEIAHVFGGVAQWLREHSHESAAVDLQLAEPMESLAFLLDEVTDHVHVCGDDEFDTKVAAAAEAAAELQLKIQAIAALADEARSELISRFMDIQKQLAGWVNRAQGRDLYLSELYDGLLSAVMEIGYQLCALSYYPLDALDGNPAASLREIGKSLHLLALTSEMNNQDRETVIDLVAENEVELRRLIQSLGSVDSPGSSASASR